METNLATIGDNTVIATTPNAMAAAQQKVIGWVNDKLAEVGKEFWEAEAVQKQLHLARAASSHIDRIMDKLRKRQRFYEKVRAALEAGYVIVPPFECQIFALRTDRETPPKEESTSPTRWQPPQGLPVLPVGEGRYVAPIAERYATSSKSRTDNSTNPPKTTEIDIYTNEAWRDVEFPIKALKPEVIEATAAAMGKLIFDSFGIAPEYRAADPIVVGFIKHYKPHTKPLTFFVAWWLDRADL